MTWRYTDDRYLGDGAPSWHDAGARMVQELGGGRYFFFEWTWDRQTLRDMAISDEYTRVFDEGAEVVLVCHERAEGVPEVYNGTDRPRYLAFTVAAWRGKITSFMYWLEGEGRARPCPWVVDDQLQAEPQAEPERPLGPPVTIGDLPFRFRFPIDTNMHDKVMRVIVDWPGACPAGRAEALHAIEQMRIDRVNRYEYAAIQYIHERFPARLEPWCRACGIMTEPRVTWFVRGCRVAHNATLSGATVAYDPRNPNTERPAWLAEPYPDGSYVFVWLHGGEGRWIHHSLLTEIV